MKTWQGHCSWERVKQSSRNSDINNSVAIGLWKQQIILAETVGWPPIPYPSRGKAFFKWVRILRVRCWEKRMKNQRRLEYLRLKK